MWLTVEEAREKFPGAVIESGAWIESGARIGRNRKGVTRAIAITTSTEYTLTGFLCDDRLIVTAGCMGDYAGLPPDDARKWIAENHGDKLALYDAFMVAVRAYLG